MKKLVAILRIIGVGSAVIWGAEANASGYHFGVQSVSAQGLANSGGAAALDATTIFYNPAGLVYLPGTQISGAVIVVDPKTSLSNVRAQTAAFAAITGSDVGGSPTSTAAVPQFYMSHQINDQLYTGLGVFVPFGDKTNYNGQWVGRYNALKLDMESIAINPQISFKLNEQFSIGAGVSAQYMRAEFTKNADFGTASGAGLAKKGFPKSLYGPLMAGNGQYDGTLHYKGKDWGFGWNIGAMWQVDPTLRIGAAYRSSISQTLSGNANWTLPTTFPAALSSTLLAGLTSEGYASSPDAKVSIKTPDSFSLNVYKNVTPEWALMADWTHTRHSKFQDLRLKFSNRLHDAVIKQNWKNTNRYALGTTYRISDPWLLRFGVAYDQSPVPSSELRIAGLPDATRVWYSLGANYAFTKDLSVDLAYTYVNIRNASMSNRESSSASIPPATGSGTLTQADFKSHANLFGVQLNYRF